MIITFIGPDGSGKTTFAKASALKLRELGYDVYFSKFYEEYFLLNYIFKFLDKKRKKQAVYFQNSTNKNFIGKIWPYILYIDLLILYIYLRLFRNKKIYIFDRYAYSYLVTFKYYKADSAFIDYLYLKYPNPDLCFLITADIKHLMKRKLYQKNIRGIHFTEKFFNFHLKLYLSLKYKINCKKIVSSGSKKKVMKVIMKIIKNYIS